MIQKPFEEVNAADIQALVANSVPEGRTLEYKELIQASTDADKKELLADVSSFANGAGGDLLFGIVEERDEGGRPTGVPAAAQGLAEINVGAEILRLESIIRDGLDPRIAGLRTKPIDGFPDGPVVLLRIPKSWSAPHMVTFKSSSRFFSRSSAGKYPLDVAEIRAAFAASEALPERIRRFRDERIGRVIAGETPLPLLPGAKVVLHLLPIQSFTQPPSLDVRTLMNEPAGLPPLYGQTWDSRPNLDGLLAFDLASDRQCIGYSQLFRNSAIETVDCLLLHPEDDGSRSIPTDDAERELLTWVRRLLQFQKEHGIVPPIFAFVAMIGVKNYGMSIRRTRLHTGADWNRVDRDTLLLPDVVVEDYSQKADVVLRPVFDAIWQSAGFPGSPNYDTNGDWVGT